MKTYKIEMMTYGGYCAMMCGSYNYSVYPEIVEAENKEQAYEIAKAKFPTYTINNHVKEITEESEIEQIKVRNEHTKEFMTKEIKELEEKLAEMKEWLANH